MKFQTYYAMTSMCVERWKSKKSELKGKGKNEKTKKIIEENLLTVQVQCQVVKIVGPKIMVDFHLGEKIQTTETEDMTGNMFQLVSSLQPHQYKQ